jgi:3-ketosteroid 9alpha-monooxygenase subunit A
MLDMGADERNTIRLIEAAPVPKRYARGWHALGLAKTFKDGKPHGIDAFGTRLVIFQGANGELNVLNAYCLHMGGNLADGRIVGDTIACPFHDWRWGGDGRCVAVPYAKRIPPGAFTRAWHAREINSHLVIWHDPEGNPPPASAELPRIEGAYSSEWSDWAWCDDIIETHPRELIDNLADMAHFFYVHGERKGGTANYFKNVFHDHVATQYLEQGSENTQPSYQRDVPYTGDPEKIDGILRSESTWNGPAYSVDYLWWRWPDGVMYSVLFLGILPINPEKFRLSLGVLTRKRPDLSDAENAKRHADNLELLRYSTFQDSHIWKNKTRIDNPLLSDGDGPVHRLRTWYEQFYVNVADVRPQSVAPFEKEVDTAYANSIWAKELAEQSTAAGSTETET